MDGEPRTATSTFTQLLSSEYRRSFFKCCFVSTETILRTINVRDGELRTATSTFTQPLSSDSSVLLYVHRNRRLIRDGSPGWPPRLSHSSWALNVVSLPFCSTSTEARLLIRDGDMGGRGRESEGSTFRPLLYLVAP